MVGWCALVPHACIIIRRADCVVGARHGGVGSNNRNRDVESSPIGCGGGLQAFAAEAVSNKVFNVTFLVKVAVTAGFWAAPPCR